MAAGLTAMVIDRASTAADLRAAGAAYRRALTLAGEPHPLAGALRFKLAWTHYRRDDFRAAFEAFLGCWWTIPAPRRFAASPSSISRS